MIPTEFAKNQLQKLSDHKENHQSPNSKESNTIQQLTYPRPPRGEQLERRRNDKNKFINKLKQLGSEGGSQKKTFPNTLPFTEQTGDRKERNKIAARESRDRKKLYIKLMQTKIEQLEAQVDKAGQQIEEMRMEIFNAQMHQDGKRKQVRNKQMHIMKKLQSLIATEDLEERNNEINICLDSIVYRIGAMGNERKAALTKLYDDLLNFSQPALYRYILWSAHTRNHLFSPADSQSSSTSGWFQQIQETAYTSKRGREEILSRIGSGLSRQRLHFANSSDKLVNVKAEIQKKGQSLDNIVNQIRQILSPEQLAKLILFIERHQFKKEVRLFEDHEEFERPPEKKVKIQEDVNYQ